MSLLSNLKKIITSVIQIEMPPHTEKNYSKSNMFVDAFCKFPLPCEWQKTYQSDLSKRVFNLIMACNVQAFSGWNEFSLRSLQNNWGGKYFGFKIEEGMPISGYLSKSLEKEMAEQWKLVQDKIPTLSLDFEYGLENVKQADWYIAAIERYKTTFSNEPVATYGENHAGQSLIKWQKIYRVQ